MGKSQVIAILFDGNPENIFYAGQLVSGHLHVQTSERIKIRGIRLEVTGKAETSWEEGSDDDRTSYSGKENYIHLELDLLGSRNNDCELYLEPSVCKLPFSFLLPPELPQSFEDRIGHIRYKAKATIDRPMRIDDTAEVLLTVIHLLDLNQEPPQLREPMVIQSETPASGCCCVDGFAEIRATINRGCFVPGETIHIEGEIANRTNTNIKYSTVTLFQNIEYCATYKNGKVYHTTDSLKTLAKFERPFLRRGHTDNWNDISFVVPQVLASRLDGCGIIHIKHFIEISATFHECCSKSTVSSEIVIGNIHLNDDFRPSIVTSQPMGYSVPCNSADGYMPPTIQASMATSQPIGYPVPYNMASGYMPPTYTPPLDFDTAGSKSWKHDDRDLPAVHKS